ncbi:hypothetical protein [Virgibacillus kimchii]
MEWEMPPHPKKGNFKLVATEKTDGEIYLTFIGEDAPHRCNLYEIEDYCMELQDYVKALLPKILSGVYDINLIEMKE